MSEVTFAKTFLSSLDRKPIKLPADHVSDPRKYPNQSPVCSHCPSYNGPSANVTVKYILPRQTHPYPRQQAPSTAQTKAKTITATLKPMRTGETVTLSDVSLDSSIHDLKTQYAAKTSHPQDKIKLLLNKKPAADLKTLSELGVDGNVEFSVMLMGGGASTPGVASPAVSSPAAEKADPAASIPSPSLQPPPTVSQADKQVVDEGASFPGSEKAQVQAESAPAPKPAAGGPSGPGALNTGEFWQDLEDFLTQRIRDKEEAERLNKLFKMAWVNQRE